MSQLENDNINVVNSERVNDNNVQSLSIFVDEFSSIAKENVRQLTLSKTMGKRKELFKLLDFGQNHNDYTQLRKFLLFIHNYITYLTFQCSIALLCLTCEIVNLNNIFTFNLQNF